MRYEPSQPDDFRLLVSAYHPEALKYPASSFISTPTERLRLAMTWNVFRTLEQIAPSAWMRRLLATSTGLPDGYDSAPHMTMVSCWSALSPAPSATLRRGQRSAIAASVIIDTDDTVIAVLTPAMTDLHDAVSDTREGGLLDVAEATAWRAGARSAYVIVVLPIEADEHVWTSRLRQRAGRVGRVLQTGAKGPTNLRGIGATTWNALTDLLSEIRGFRFISQSERQYAANAADWMAARLRGPGARSATPRSRSASSSATA